MKSKTTIWMVLALSSVLSMGVLATGCEDDEQTAEGPTEVGAPTGTGTDDLNVDVDGDEPELDVQPMPRDTQTPGQQPGQQTGQQQGTGAQQQPGPQRSLLELIQASNQHQTLAQAIQAAGLADTFRGGAAGQQQYTVFAPTDQAFQQLPQGALQDLLRPENRQQLQALLQAHVVDRKVELAEMQRATTLRTLGGQSLSVRSQQGTTLIGEARVQNGSEASNGALYVIDQVLMPEQPQGQQPQQPGQAPQGQGQQPQQPRQMQQPAQPQEDLQPVQ